MEMVVNTELKNPVTPSELARRADRSLSSIYLAVRTGTLAAVRVGKGRFLIDGTEAESWLAKVRAGGAK